MQNKTIAIIVAGGSGKRMSSNIPKQFLLLNSKPIIIHTLEVFNKCNSINEIIVVCVEEYINYCEKLVEKYNVEKVKKIISGGKERLFSVYNAINYVNDDEDLKYICVHDAVRPFVTEEVINKTIKECATNPGCICGVRAKDTIKKLDENGRNTIEKTLPREKIFLAYTPQTFRKEILKSCYDKAVEENFLGTDDASICERYGYKIKVVDSNPENIKITNRSDLRLGEGFLEGNLFGN